MTLQLLQAKSYLTLLLLFFSTVLTAQYNFTQITKDHGLPHNNIECILQTETGFMWFGTRDGLCRFDGYEIKVFRNTSNPNSISGNRILSLAEDDNGFIWVGTYKNGVNRFDPRTNEFIQYGLKDGIGEQIYTLKKLKDGTICVGSNNGLALFNNGSFTVFLPNSTTEGINSFQVSDILETHNGELYVATWENDIQKFDIKKGSFESIKYIQRNETSNYRKRLLEDQLGNIWISASQHGLYKYNRKTNKAQLYNKQKNGLSTEMLTGAMVMNSDGKIWIATDGDGINIIDPSNNTFEYIKAGNGEFELSSNQVYSLVKDKKGRIWVGTFDKGIAYYDPFLKKFTNRELPKIVQDFFKGKSVLCLLQDSKDNIWIGTDGSGLHRFDKDRQFLHFYNESDNDRSVSGNVITSLGEDQNGNILIGTYNAGLNIFDYSSNSFRHYHQNHEDNKAIHSENVWTILSDSKGTNWLGLLGGGVDIFDASSGNFKNIGPYSNELIKVGHANVMSILEDSDGDIWFGTEGAGVFVYDKQVGRVLRISSKNTFTTNGIIKALFQDSWGKIWIGTEGNGLYRYDKKEKEFVQFTTENGLPGMIVLGVLEDNQEGIWITTYDGIAILKKGENEFLSFNSSDGLSSNEFNAQAFIQLIDGSFLAGSTNGLDRFNPLDLTFNKEVPPVYFTQLKILNQEVLPGDTINREVKLKKDISYTDEIELNYSDKVFSLEFAALNYTHPQKCQYQYKLEGFDDNWYFSDSDHRFVSYTNLKNGMYTLKVKASNNDNVFGDNITELRIRVLPPYWKTWWFISLIVLLIAILTYAVYAYRVQMMKSKFLREQALNQKKIAELEMDKSESELQKLTYHTINRNRVLLEYKNKMVTLSTKAMPAVKKGLQFVIDEIDKEINDDKEWKYLEPRLDKMYNEFITKLREKHPSLSLSEIKVASYVRMNLTSKEIAEFMHKTTRAIENDRYRLRKKLELDSNDSLQKYLMDI